MKFSFFTDEKISVRSKLHGQVFRNVDCGYTLLVVSIHNQYFEQKYEKSLFSDIVFQFLQLKKISVYCMGVFL